MNNDDDWDPTLGVWKTVQKTDISTLDPPLFIYGYGSLIWNPGPLLEKFESFHCVAKAWKRVFAQKSCDHRG